MAPLDPEMEFLLRQEMSAGDPETAADGGAESAAAPGTREVRLLLHHRGDLGPARHAGFRVTASAGTVAAGFAPLDAVKRIAAAEGVVLVEAPRPLLGELDLSLAETRANVLHAASPACRGAGVLVGIIDSGIDFRHGCFISNNKTRILALWDQGLLAEAGETAPTPFGYGVEYTRAHIDAELAPGARPALRVRHVDRKGHGTHVAGIAAGNGNPAGSAVRQTLQGQFVELFRERPAGTYVGVAPEADLLVVAYKDRGDDSGVGESAELLDAISYLLAKAAELRRPIVINVSQGDYLGPHDGTSAVEKYIDEHFGHDQPGRAIVKSAGNASAPPATSLNPTPAFTHASGRVSSGEQVEVPFAVPAGERTHIVIDLWYSGEDEFVFALRQPDGALSERVSPSEPEAASVELRLPNGNVAIVKSSRHWPTNRDNRIHVRLMRGADGQPVSAGQWRLVLTGASVTDGGFHAWIDRATVPVPRFEGPFANNDSTISIPGTSRQVITVGSYVTRLDLEDSHPKTMAVARALAGRLMPTTSLGPARDGFPKPELAAPGEAIISARANGAGNQHYRIRGGTSFSAPHAAGAIALLFEKRPGLTQPQVRKLLLDHARKDNFTTAPAEGWGAGKLDVQASHDALINGFGLRRPEAEQAKGDVNMSKAQSSDPSDATPAGGGGNVGGGTESTETVTISQVSNREAGEAVTVSIDVSGGRVRGLSAHDQSGNVYEVAFHLRRLSRPGTQNAPPVRNTEAEPSGDEAGNAAGDGNGGATSSSGSSAASSGGTGAAGPSHGASHGHGGHGHPGHDDDTDDCQRCTVRDGELVCVTVPCS